MFKIPSWMRQLCLKSVTLLRLPFPTTVRGGWKVRKYISSRNSLDNPLVNQVLWVLLLLRLFLLLIITAKHLKCSILWLSGVSLTSKLIAETWAKSHVNTWNIYIVKHYFASSIIQKWLHGCGEDDRQKLSIWQYLKNNCFVACCERV